MMYPCNHGSHILSLPFYPYDFLRKADFAAAECSVYYISYILSVQLC